MWGAAPFITIILFGLDILFNAIVTCKHPIVWTLIAPLLEALLLALIIYKLWTTYASLPSITLHRSKWLVLIRILVESGILYVLSELSVVVSDPFGNLSVCVAGAAAPIIVSLSFAMQ